MPLRAMFADEAANLPDSTRQARGHSQSQAIDHGTRA
jgi:hypothetical protein